MPEKKPAPLTIRQLKAARAPLVIFGSGPVGEMLLHACRGLGLKPAAFCDNNIHKKKNIVNGLPVVYAPDLPGRFPAAVFLIAAADIGDVVNQLGRLGYTRWTDSSLLKHFDVGALPLSVTPEAAEFVLSACLLCHENYLRPRKLFIRSVDVIVTERCSLRCRDCSNLMQYYARPVNCDAGEVLRSIDALCRRVDELNEFRIIGGEPFMHPQLDRIVRRLTAEPKVRRVVINTNATLLPRPGQLNSLKDGKILLMITDYGALSRGLAQLTALARENGIAYFVKKSQGWTDCSGILRHGRTPAEQQRVFSRCCAKNLITLSDGLLFRCPFIANAVRLRALPAGSSDFLDLRAPAGSAAAVTRKAVRGFIGGLKYFEACDYCSGRFYDDPEIPPALQAERPLAYRRHSQPGSAAGEE